MHDPQQPTERAESPTPTPEPDKGAFRATLWDRATLPGDIVVADGLPLERLYARFDAIPRGRAPVSGSAAHQSALERLASNQRRAEALGWTEFVLERAGASGRLVLRGTPPIGPDRALVPDAVPYSGAEPLVAPGGAKASTHDAEGRIGTDLTDLSWRSRMGWLDDGGR